MITFPGRTSKITLVTLFTLLYMCGNSQHVYFAMGGGINISHLRISKEIGRNPLRTELYNPGGEGCLAVGIVPLKTKVSPVFEFKAAYLYRKFGQKETGKYYKDSTQTNLNYSVTVVKESHDIAFSLLVGVRYKQFVFVTGPVIEKFLMKRETLAEYYEGSFNMKYTYTAGTKNYEYKKLRYYWNFRASYDFNLKKNFRLTPFADYILGISPQNQIDTGAKLFGGYLCHGTLGIRVEYCLNLKKKVDESKK